MVDLSTIDSAFQFLIINGYWIMFVVMIFEGPIVTTAASFAASLGYFNIWVIVILGFFGNFLGDSLVYGIGYFARKKVLKDYNHIFKIKRSWVKNIENHFRNHLGKTLFMVKLTPFAFAGLLLAGASRINFKRYILWCSLVSIPEVLFFAILGYSFGVIAGSVLGYYQEAQYLLMIAIFVLFLAYFIGKKLYGGIIKKRMPI